MTQSAPSRKARIVLISFESLLVLVAVLLLVILSNNQYGLPEAKSYDAPAGEFSSGRAIKYIEAIAQKPRPIGSQEHMAVRNYIQEQLRSLGVEPEVQKATIVDPSAEYPFPAATVHNILTRIKGTDGTKTIMLAAHYDSVATSFGANDDASGVSIMLETLRALKTNPPLKNDLILLFTDGEEIGLLGSKAFVNQHPWAKDVSLALNLEARGTSGPSLMFETSPKNSWLIEEFGKAVSNPVSNSFMHDVYQALPNDTDFTVFKKAKMAGYNFAYIEGVVGYHSMLDNLSRLDERSLQHQGEQALALVRHLGNIDLVDKHHDGSVYFNVGSFLIRYPDSWVLPLTAFATLLFVALIILGLRARRFSLRGIFLGAFFFLITLIIVPLVIIGLWIAISNLHSDYKLLALGDVYNSKTYVIAFILVAVAASLSLYNLYRKKVSLPDLVAGALSLWLILLISSSLYMVGSSYLFLWPFLAGLVPLTFVSDQSEKVGVKYISLLLGSTLPAILIFVPLIFLLFVVLTINVSSVPIFSLVLMLGLMIPLMAIVSAKSKWLVPGGLAVVSLFFITFGIITSGFNKDDPKVSDLFYAANADTGKSVWASIDQEPNEWTSQFFSSGVEKSRLTDVFPTSSRSFLQSQAPAATSPPPQVALIKEEKNGEKRILHLLITSPSHAPVISVYLDADQRIQRAMLGDKTVDYSAADEVIKSRNLWALRYYALPESGVELILETESTEPLKLKIVELTYGLPNLPGFNGKPRPDYIISANYPFSDSTLIVKSFSF